MKRFIHDASPIDMLDAFQQRVQELKSQPIESSEDAEDHGGWELLEVKDIRDFNGFWTEYSLWHNVETDEYATYFGDTELYSPLTGEEPDMADFETEDEAWDWFYDYDTDDQDTDLDF